MMHGNMNVKFASVTLDAQDTMTVDTTCSYCLHILMSCLKMARSWPTHTAKNSITKVYGSDDCDSFVGFGVTC